ncbi:hypothetical protein Q5P01_023990 [Channa striata]|uniref:Uncharacterized protein n=1 Tax=Channa striata TaxID=64152 RepID=A0AA88LR53_CHASR|nr:hypothetical protein Q5P01_023990 [Channa striata]
MASFRDVRWQHGRQHRCPALPFTPLSPFCFSLPVTTASGFSYNRQLFINLLKPEVGLNTTPETPPSKEGDCFLAKSGRVQLASKRIICWV